MSTDYPAPTDEQARALLWCHLSRALRDTFPGHDALTRSVNARRAVDTYVDALEHAYERAHRRPTVGDHVRVEASTMNGRYRVTALDGEYAMLAHAPAHDSPVTYGRWAQRIENLTVESEPA